MSVDSLLQENCSYALNARKDHEDSACLAVDDHRVEAEHPMRSARLLFTCAHGPVLCVALDARRAARAVDARVVHVPEARLVAHIEQLNVRQPHRIQHTVAVEAGELLHAARRNDHLPAGRLLEQRHHQRGAVPRLRKEFVKYSFTIRQIYSTFVKDRLETLNLQEVR